MPNKIVRVRQNGKRGIEMEALTAIQRRVFQHLFEYYLPLFTYRVCQAYFGTGDRRDIACYPV